jgi:hypothetical protein
MLTPDNLLPATLNCTPWNFLRSVEEIVEVFNAYIFNAKVINNKAELDGMPFMAPETWSQGHFVETFGN